MAEKLLLPPSPLHRARYVKNKVLGMSTEQLAREEGIQEKYIKMSIARVESFHALNTVDELEASQINVVLFNAEMEKQAIHESLQATTVVYDDKGKRIDETPNHEVRLLAVKMITEKVDSIIGSKPSGGSGGNNVNVNVLNAPGSSGVGIATFEDRLREVKRKRGLLEQTNPSPVSSDSDEESDVDEITPDWEGRTFESSP